MSHLADAIAVNTMMRGLLRKYLADIGDTELYERRGANSPGWILGHLILVNKMGCKLLGNSDIEPATDDQRKYFGPGSDGDVPPDHQRTLAELLEQEEATAQQLSSAASAASEELLDAPNPSQALGKALPTVRLMATHILVSHLALHSGQVSAWRRAANLPPILQFPK